MRYWVYGVDGVSKEPREPLFIEADSEEAARQQARDQGMEVAEIDPVQPRSEGTPAHPAAEPHHPPVEGRPLLRAFTIGLRVLAAVALIWGAINTGLAVEAANTASRARAQLPGKSAEAGLTASEAHAIFTAVLMGLSLAAVLMALAEGLRLALVIEHNTHSQRVVVHRDRKKHHRK
jgi:hypothetical protein